MMPAAAKKGDPALNTTFADRPAPLGAAGRLDALDVLRGFAVLGIFAINIWFMALPEAFYINGTALGPLTGTDQTVWTGITFLIAQKFVTLFSLMFGAGIALMAGKNSGKRHVPRMVWLLVFGLAHAYLLWPGDILVTYAICGLLVIGIRSWTPRGLVILAAILLAIGAIIQFLFIYSVTFAPPDVLAETTASVWAPSQEAIDAEIDQRRQGSFLAHIPINIEQALFFQTVALPLQTGWRICGLMALGMALYKWDVLTGNRSTVFYAICMVIGFAVGAPMMAQSLAIREASGWDFVQVMAFGEAWTYWASLAMAMGWMGLVMLFVKSGTLGVVRRAFAAAGRMAFTNYIMQSVIGATLFFGWGFGLFGTMGVTDLFYVTLAVWLAQLIWSPLWLSIFQFGPLEWLWRALTYGQWPPFRRA